MTDDRFLWARLQIAHVCNATTKTDLLSALEELPSGLTETYRGIWIKVQQQRFSRRTLAERTLELLLYSVQLLSAHAVAEAVTPNAGTYVRDNEIVDVALVLDVCQGLIVLDPELDILRPIHFTAQAFLEDKFPLSRSHAQIATNCLRWISDRDTLYKALNKSFDPTGTIANFVTYAILNWPVHVRWGGGDSLVDSLEQQFISDELLHHLWITNLRALGQCGTKKMSLLLYLLKAYPNHYDVSLISACFFGLCSLERAIDDRLIQIAVSNYPIKAEYFS